MELDAEKAMKEADAVKKAKRTAKQKLHAKKAFEKAQMIQDELKKKKEEIAEFEVKCSRAAKRKAEADADHQRARKRFRFIAYQYDELADSIETQKGKLILSPFQTLILSKDKPSCSVCYEEYTTERQESALPCGHRFCFLCIKSWLKSRGRDCPTCRKKFSEKQVYKLF